MMPLPLNAARIRLEWPIEQGGFAVTARTDRAGLPIIGLYSLNPKGLPTGEPIEFAHGQLVLRVVAGHDEEQHPITVIADIIIDYQGLALRVIMPEHMIERGYDRYLFVAWSSQSAESPLIRLFNRLAIHPNKGET
jgi:hypothetical protein